MDDNLWTIRCRTVDNSGSFTLHKTFGAAKDYINSLPRNSRIVAIERPDGSDGWGDFFVAVEPANKAAR